MIAYTQFIAQNEVRMKGILAAPAKEQAIAVYYLLLHMYGLESTNEDSKIFDRFLEIHGERMNEKDYPVAMHFCFEMGFHLVSEGKVEA